MIMIARTYCGVFCLFKYFIYLFMRDTEREREREREREAKTEAEGELGSMKRT